MSTGSTTICVPEGKEYPAGEVTGLLTMSRLEKIRCENRTQPRHSKVTEQTGECQDVLVLAVLLSPDAVASQRQDGGVFRRTELHGTR